MPTRPKFNASTNAIGDFGELLAATFLSRPVRGKYRRPLFKPTHLGEKYPVVDFIVDVLDPTENSIGFFFVQVKSTSAACALSRTLRLDVELEKYNKLAAIPVPTFLIGVDTQNESAFMIAAPKAVLRTFSSITKKHDLADDDVRVGLYKEVAEYWRKNRSHLIKARTQFTNER
jgi:Domain of unknown function (DUF4365)